VKARRPATRIIGIEPVGSPTLHACIQAGRLVALDRLETRVATMSCRQTDQAIFEVVRDKVDEIILVSDAEMESAARQRHPGWRTLPEEPFPFRQVCRKAGDWLARIVIMRDVDEAAATHISGSERCGEA
jgi:hypothetical protein